MSDPVDPTQNYLTTFAYDAVGNIDRLNRNGCRTSTIPLEMDRLHYSYSPTPNRLSGISDPVSSGNYPTDLDDQSNPSNYIYDATGNLIQDASEGIYGIEWNIANKPVQISNSDQSRSIACLYDPMGERVVKQTNTKTQVYIRDASGNILAVYSKGIGEDTTTWFENSYIYGTARLGELSYKGKTYQPPKWKHDRMRGWRHYELTNHLGNVMAVVTDRKHSIDTDGDYLWNYNLADVAAVNDYYPGGMLMPGRSYSGSSASYRFGMNGQEKDDEIAGNGSIYSALYWEYDSRSLRRWNLDPKPTFGVSDYSCFGGNPIWFSDPLGDKIKGKTNNDANNAKTEMAKSLGSNGTSFVSKFFKVGQNKTLEYTGPNKKDMNQWMYKRGKYKDREGEAFTPKQAAMANGYAMMVKNSSYTIEVEFNNQSVDESGFDVTSSNTGTARIGQGSSSNQWLDVNNNGNSLNTTQTFVHELLGEAFSYSSYKDMYTINNRKSLYNNSTDWSNDPILRNHVLHVIQAENLYNDVNRSGLQDHLPRLNPQDINKVGQVPEIFKSSFDEQVRK